MAFQTPIGIPLTETQEKTLAQLSAVKNLLSLPEKKIRNIDKDKQISAFDYTLRLTESTIGSAFIDIMLKSFIDKVFDPNNDKLEQFIITALSKSLDKNNKKISSTQSNKEWLTINTLPALKVSMTVAKTLIAKQIIVMIFGPKEKMSDDTKEQNDFLDYAVCADSLFSTSGELNETQGDIEFNTVELRKRLEKGEVQFVVSCQDVKIKLPENIDSLFDSVLDNNSNKNRKPINPSMFFEQINNHVGVEMQRINSQENANSIKKSFLQIMVDKIINLITVAIEPQIAFVFNMINSGPNGNIGANSSDIISNPCEIKDLCESDEEKFNKKSAFSASMMNLIYALLCSIILQRLIQEIKKMIKNAVAKKVASKIQRRASKQKQHLEILEKSGEAVEKSQKIKIAFDSIKDVFDFDQTA